MCCSRKYLYYPHRGEWNFLGGKWGAIRPKNLKKCMKLNQNFQRGRYDIFWSYTLSIA